MGCITSIAIAAWLIAFTGGVLLLYKVQKENLQWPFRVAGWLVVIVALGGMLCCSLRCMMRSCHDGACGRPPMMMPYMHHGMCQSHCGDERCYKGGQCEREDEECCEEDENECKKHEEKEISITIHSDSAEVKKK